MGGFFFFSLRQEVICSVQQAFCWEGFLRSVSHALALSRQAGKQAAVRRDYLLFPRSIRDHRQHRPFSVLLLFWIFEARNQRQQQQHHRWKPNKLHHNTGSLLETFLSLHPLPPLPQCCVSMDCVCIFLSDGLDCSSGFHWEQIGLWRQQQQQQQLNTTTTVTSIEKIAVRWPVIAKRRLLPVPLLLCYRRG